MSSAIYGIVKTLHKPTAVDACCNCHFFSHEEENLVVASANCLHIYRIVTEEDDNISSSGAKQKLECAASYNLFGNIESVSSLRLPYYTRDIVILACKDAKLSVVEYDPRSHDLVTLSLHYFEEDELKSGLFSNFKKPIVRIDPDLRCIVMLVYGCQLVVFPLRKDLMSDDVNASKSPFAPSYIIDLSKLDEKIHNIMDIQFLHGYYEPTLFILYEPIRTWAGRLPVRRDTCKIAAISLNMQERVHPVIWSLDNLPFDCQKTLAVPKPIGGVLVFAATSLIYMNQSVPPYAASLTSITSLVSQFPMKPQETIALTLDNSHAALISSDQVVISTKSGEMYVTNMLVRFVMTLCLDSMRAVKQFHFDRAASSVLPSCLCLIGDGFMFLGSRLGNSLLLKYSKKDITTGSELQQKPAVENVKKPESQDWLASDAVDLEKELDELEVYGATEVQRGKEDIINYQFQVCDSIMNIGPCGRITLGEPAFLSEELSPLCQVDHDIELVSTSGYGKNGALTFLQRTVRPQIITTFQLPDVREMWTVKGPLNSDDISQEEEQNLDASMHSYLILGKDDSTMILQTTDDISELDHSGYNTQDYTVYAGNIGDKYTVQVTAKGIRLLLGVKQLQNIPVDIGSAVSSATITDPYLLITSEQGALMLLQLRISDDGEARLTVLKQPSDIDVEAVALCLYKDVSGIFSCDTKLSAPLLQSQISQPRHSVSISEDSKPNDTMEEEDEDELLYGDSEISITLPELGNTNTESKQTDTPDNETSTSTQSKTVVTRKIHSATYWSVIATKDNCLEIYSVPDFKLVFACAGFNTGHQIIFDSETHISKESDVKSVPSSIPQIKELLLAGLGSLRQKPYIFARTVNETLFIYEIISSELGTEGRLQIKLRRSNHDLILRERRRVARKRQADTADEKTTQYSKQLLRTFDNIGGYSGVFIGGSYPHWFVLSSKGVLRCHPMSIDNSITCMSPFHNVNCPNGFMYFNRQDELRISILPAHLSYEHQWPLRKVPLKTTVYFVRYEPVNKVYVVVCSRRDLCKKLVKIENDEKQFIEQDRDERFVFPSKEQYFVQLFSPINCEPIPNTIIDADDCEAFTAVEILSLSPDEGACRNFIGISTNNSFNEEVTSKGRILIYEVIDVVPEPGLPLTKNKMKEIYAKEQKGPVTSITSVDGMLIAAIGQKIYVYQLKDNDLVGVSFIDSQVYIHQMVSIKSLILVADIHMSISVLRYQNDHRVLSTVSRDVKPMEVYSVEFFVDNTTLGFIATDRDNNLSVYMYQPDVIQSSGGTVLLRKADINIGTGVNSLCRVRCKLSDPTTQKQFSGIIEKKHVTYYATVDGGIGFLLPITERVYRRLDMTQRILYTYIPHTAGLNPKTYRSVKSQSKMLQNAQHNLIDGDLVWKYLSLSHPEQQSIAKRMGTTPDQIIEDLLEIDRVTTHF